MYIYEYQLLNRKFCLCIFKYQTLNIAILLHIQVFKL